MIAIRYGAAIVYRVLTAPGPALAAAAIGAGDIELARAARRRKVNTRSIVAIVRQLILESDAERLVRVAVGFAPGVRASGERVCRAGGGRTIDDIAGSRHIHDVRNATGIFPQAKVIGAAWRNIEDAV